MSLCVCTYVIGVYYSFLQLRSQTGGCIFLDGVLLIVLILNKQFTFSAQQSQRLESTPKYSGGLLCPFKYKMCVCRQCTELGIVQEIIICILGKTYYVQIDRHISSDFVCINSGYTTRASLNVFDFLGWL